ncbi:unnamed protein product [Durusdinium trenchii]|uniref:Uncharacterized protein n=1 Tax=Durusdinium trenchii TaxID=1381693 RepID=A0ABP0M9K0_9DINO
MLQNVDQAFYCGLLCQADAQCPSGASCRKVGTQNVGLCIHPLSFSDWARLSSRMKLSIGWVCWVYGWGADDQIIVLP